MLRQLATMRNGMGMLMLRMCVLRVYRMRLVMLLLMLLLLLVLLLLLLLHHLIIVLLHLRRNLRPLLWSSARIVLLHNLECPCRRQDLSHTNTHPCRTPSFFGGLRSSRGTISMRKSNVSVLVMDIAVSLRYSSVSTPRHPAHQSLQAPAEFSACFPPYVSKSGV